MTDESSYMIELVLVMSIQSKVKKEYGSITRVLQLPPRELNKAITECCNDDFTQLVIAVERLRKSCFLKPKIKERAWEIFLMKLRRAVIGFKGYQYEDDKRLEGLKSYLKATFTNCCKDAIKQIMREELKEGCVGEKPIISLDGAKNEGDRHDLGIEDSSVKQPNYDIGEQDERENTLKKCAVRLNLLNNSPDRILVYHIYLIEILVTNTEVLFEKKYNSLLEECRNQPLGDVPRIIERRYSVIVGKETALMNEIGARIEEWRAGRGHPNWGDFRQKFDVTDDQIKKYIKEVRRSLKHRQTKLDKPKDQ